MREPNANVRCPRHPLWASLIALLAFGVFDACANEAGKALEEVRGTMRRAKADGDWRTYLTAARKQANLLNGSPPSRLELARAEVHLGDFNAALSEVGGFVRMGQSPELLDSLPDLAPLRPIGRFAAIRKAGADNVRPVSAATLAFRLADRDLLPEDIDYDPATRRFYISSVLQKKIVTATMQGELAEFARSPDGWPVFALKIDRKNGFLWASEIAVPGFEGIEPSVQGRSALLCYELRSAKLIRRIEGPRPSSLGDIVLSSDGTVIVSDGEHGGIYRVRSADVQMERIDGGDFISPQTATMADATHILVPDYLRGLGILAIGTREVTWLSMQGRYALNGIDGLYRDRNRLIAVQNGVSPERVVIFSLNPAGTKVIAQDIIERSTPTLGDPTHGVIVSDDFYFIANSGWDVLDESGKVKAGMTLTEPMVMKSTLSANGRNPGRRAGLPEATRR